LPEQQFSSQQYHASVEVELPDGLTAQQLEQRTRQTFALVRESVERELLNGSQPQGRQATTANETAPADSPVTGSDSQPVFDETPATATAARVQAPTQAPAAERASTGARASGRQVKYLLDLAAGQGKGVNDLNREAARRYGVDDIHALSRRQASDLIGSIAGRTQAARKAA